MIEARIWTDERVPRGKFCLASNLTNESAYNMALQETYNLPIRQLFTFDMVLIYSAQLAIEEWMLKNNPRSLTAVVHPDDFEEFPLENLLLFPYPEQVRASFSRNVFSYDFLLPRRK